MRGKHRLYLGIIWLALLLTPALLLGATSIKKGTSINTSNADFQYGIVSSKNESPSGVGTAIYDGLAEYTPAGTVPCNTATFTGTITGSTISSVSDATVLVRRYTNSGTHTSGSPSSTIIASTLEYTITACPSVPSLVGFTIKRSEWEAGSNTGTTYNYFKPNTFFYGRVEGDTHGVLILTGYDESNNAITQTRMTSANGVQNTGTITTVWNNPVIYALESAVTYTDVTVYYGSVSLTLNSPEGCLPAHSSNHSGTSFYIPAFNAGLYADNWMSSTGSSGYAFNFTYILNAGTEIVPRVIGLTKLGAEDIIFTRGFRLGNVTYATSSVYPTGRVISQSVAAGSTANLNSAIDLVVSTGSTAACECDLNQDGRCNMLDWGIFGKNWGRTNCPQ